MQHRPSGRYRADHARTNTTSQRNHNRDQGPGVASVAKKGPGRWQLRAFLGRTADGTPIHRSKTVSCATKKHAAMLAQQWETELRSSGYVVGGAATTVAEVADLWLDRLDREAHLERGTLYHYRAILGRHVRDDIGNRRISTVTVRDLDQFYLRVRDRAPLMPRKVHVVLRQVWKEAIRLGIVASSPLPMVTMPRSRRTAKEWPTLDEIGRMIEAAATQGPWHPRFLFVASGTGARRGELAAMRWSSVTGDDDAGWWWHLDSAVASVPQTGTYVKGTKTHASRHVPLHLSTVAVIEQQMTWQRERATVNGVALIADPFLWSARHDGAAPPAPGTLTLLATKAARDAGVAASLHTLRHVFASFLINEGESVLTVQQILGHASGVTTIASYGHADREKVAAAVRHLGGIKPALPRSSQP